MKAIDLIGKRFGRLVVIERAGTKRREIAWLCRCDCGKEIVVPGNKLRSGHTKSCGCLRNRSPRTFIDLTGRHFGRLTVLERAGCQNGYATWRCRCVCGKEIIAVSTLLLHGEVKSCGCLVSDEAKERQPLMIKAVIRDGTSRNIESTKTRSPFGVRGVGLSNCKSKRYEAQLTFRRKTVLRKTFETLEEAIAARKDAEEKYYKPLIEKWRTEDA